MQFTIDACSALNNGHQMLNFVLIQSSQCLSATLQHDDIFPECSDFGVQMVSPSETLNVISRFACVLQSKLVLLDIFFNFKEKFSSDTTAYY